MKMNVMDASKRALLASSIAVVAVAGIGTTSHNVLAAEVNSQTSVESTSVKVPTQEVKQKAETTREDSKSVEMEDKDGNVKYIRVDYVLEYYTDYGYDLTDAGIDNLNKLDTKVADAIAADKSGAKPLQKPSVNPDVPPEIDKGDTPVKDTETPVVNPTDTDKDADKVANKAPVKIPGKTIADKGAMIGDGTDIRISFGDYYMDPDGDKLTFTASVNKGGKQENVNIYNSQGYLELLSNNTGKTVITIKVEDGKGGVLNDSFVFNVIPDPTAPDIGAGNVAGGENPDAIGDGTIPDNGEKPTDGQKPGTDVTPDGEKPGSGTNTDGNTPGNGTNTDGKTSENGTNTDGKTSGSVTNTDGQNSETGKTSENQKPDADSKDSASKSPTSETKTEVKKDIKTLPQTGSETSGLTSVIGVALLGLASALGIRRKK